MTILLDFYLLAAVTIVVYGTLRIFVVSFLKFNKDQKAKIKEEQERYK